MTDINNLTLGQAVGFALILVTLAGMLIFAWFWKRPKK